MLKQKMEAADLLPPGADLGQLRAFARIFREHHAIRYEPAGAVPLPITLVCAEDAGGEVRAASSHDAARGWRRYASGPVEVVVVPGSHTSMIAQPHVASLASAPFASST